MGNRTIAPIRLTFANGANEMPTAAASKVSQQTGTRGERWFSIERWQWWWWWQRLTTGDGGSGQDLLLIWENEE